jgi:hypothetical protein
VIEISFIDRFGRATVSGTSPTSAMTAASATKYTI